MEQSLEEMAYRELATIFVAEIGESEGYELQEYAIITCAIRWALKGVSRSFLEETIDELSMADNISLT